MSLRVFGRLEGREVPEVTIAAGGIEARIIGWGAVLRDLVVPDRAGRRRHAVLGLNTIEDYVAYSPSFGAVVGRYANRIGSARFPLGGREVRLIPNEGPNTLHGGPDGFGRRVWSLAGHDATRAHLTLTSEDGDGGWPGRVHAVATYEIAPPDTLRMILQAFSEASTPLNLTVHNYFNLDGSPDARSHLLQVAADQVLAVDAGQVPTGAISSLDNSPYDFRTLRTVREAPDRNLDATYVLKRAIEQDLSPIATLISPVSGIRMEVWTSEPGLQVYDGHKIGIPVPGLDERPYGPCAGIALETQRFPDGPNHPHFPPSLLVPGQVSRQVTELRFGIAD